MSYWVFGQAANGLPMEAIYSGADSPELARAEAEQQGMIVERIEEDNTLVRKRRLTRRTGGFELAEQLAWVFRIFAILMMVWTALEILAVMTGLMLTAVDRPAPQSWASLGSAMVAILVRGVWLTALNLAIAEVLRLLLAIEARGPKANVMDHTNSADEEKEPFWQGERRKLDLQ